MRFTLWGKHPDHGDFVSAGIAGGSQKFFEQWVHENVDEVRLADQAPAFDPLYFVIRTPSARLIGVLVPSTDSVGRAFPLAAYQELEDSSSAIPYSCLPVFLGDWLAHTLKHLRHNQAGVEGLARALQDFPASHLADAAKAFTLCRQALTQSASTLVRRVVDTSPSATHYALQTLMSACASPRENPCGNFEMTLACPVSDVRDVLTWLETIRLLVRRNDHMPSFVWPAAANAERKMGDEPVLVARAPLFVSLGAPSALILRAAALPTYEADSLWPLATQSEQARESATRALSPTVLGALEQDVPLSTLLDVAGGGHD